MMRSRMRALLELVSELVSEDGPWHAKRNKLLTLASEDEITKLEEFASWFESKE